MNSEKKINKWRKLDNSAKIFPIISNKRFSSVFRLSAILKEEIKKEILIKATNNALEKFSDFKVVLKKGVFWYYFEENTKPIFIEEENTYPCKYIDKNINNGYLFRVTYFKNKINLDVFHSLTDGNNAMQFFKEIVYEYIELSHPEKFEIGLRTDRKQRYNIEDSYIKNYDKKLKGNIKSKKAYILKGKKLPLDAIGVTHQIINLEELKKKATQKSVTITQYLTSVLIYAINKANYLEKDKKKPIKICVPVNLKKYFPSETLSNFFSYITVNANMKKLVNFDDIVEFVKKDFEKKLQKEEIIKTMSGNVKLGNNLFIRIIPLFLKKFTVNISYIEIRKYTTTTYSNIGRIGIIQEYKEYIENFLMLIAPERVEKIKCSSCSYENNIIFTFTSILSDTKIEKEFYEFLKHNEIGVKIETNGVYEEFIS
ncbi:MAG: hypothetical protein HFJ53_07585 [Clostridia bacterium]|jgi:hypothetical protein|nr:hypothetical protein [Clostridia bacterium]